MDRWKAVRPTFCSCAFGTVAEERSKPHAQYARHKVQSTLCRVTYVIRSPELRCGITPPRNGGLPTAPVALTSRISRTVWRFPSKHRKSGYRRADAGPCQASIRLDAELSTSPERKKSGFRGRNQRLAPCRAGLNSCRFVEAQGHDSAPCIPNLRQHDCSDPGVPSQEFVAVQTLRNFGCRDRLSMALSSIWTKYSLGVRQSSAECGRT